MSYNTFGIFKITALKYTDIIAEKRNAKYKLLLCHINEL